MIEKQIGRHESDQRLDRWLRKAFPNASLSTLFGILRKKKVRLNGKVAKGPEMVQENDQVCIYENLQDTPSNATPATSKSGWGKPKQKVDSRVVLVLRTDDFVVLDKPAGLASQPGSNQMPGDSLVELLWTWAEEEYLDFKPALVHRLDQETSGLIIAALSGQAVRGLNARIREHKVRKEYVALVKGHLQKKQGTIELALDRTDSAKGAKMDVGHGKAAITHYRVERELPDSSLVRIRLETGRMHQIRAHFAAIGHPLFGDGRYGDFALNRELRKRLGLKRLFLHSALLEFEWNGEMVLVERELPAELQKAVQLAEANQ